MLCEKCNTSMDTADEACKTCGAAVPKLNRSWSKFAKISIVTVVVAAFVAYVVMHNLDMIDYGLFEDMFVSAPDAADEVPPDEGEEVPPDDVNDDVYEAVVFRRTDEEQVEVLSAVLSAVDAYLRDFSHHNPIISNAGYLYNASESLPVSVRLLVEHGYLDSHFENENVLVLFLRPMDLMSFEEVALGELSQSSRERKAVFLAYQVPVGFGLYSDIGRHLIYRENLNELLIGYARTNAEIARPASTDAVYQAALSMIASTNPDDEVFMRYLAVDDVHGFAAFSLASDPHVVRNYIFVMESGSARLLARDFEATLHPIVAINGAAPNFNFNLMPNYDIARVSLQAPPSPIFEAILNTMRQNGQFDEDEEPVFISATDSFAYIVNTQDNRFFGQQSAGGEWVVVQVDNWQTAEQLMYDFVHIPPLYIVWQQ